MNVNYDKFDEIDTEDMAEDRTRIHKAEKFRMRRIEYKQRRKRPAQFNGIHRRRRRKV